MPELVYSQNRERLKLAERSDRDLLCLLRSDDELALAELVARKTRALLQVTARIVRDLGLQITICVGVAGEPAAATGYDLDRLVHLADRAMYAAKQAGRNQVRVAQPSKAPAAPARSA